VPICSTKNFTLKKEAEVTSETFVTNKLHGFTFKETASFKQEKCWVKSDKERKKSGGKGKARKERELKYQNLSKKIK
jgi:hypothetical protein